VGTAPGGDRLIGRGRTAAVYDLGDGRVLRRTLDPEHDATGEADAMRLAASAGVPVPRVHDVAGPDLVMDRVVGPTMLEDLVAHPDRLDHHAAILADLHGRLDAVDADAATADGLPDGTTPPLGLLHGDLHPANVLLTATGPVLIDWTNYRFGPRRVDLAVTWIVLACFGHDDLVAAGISSGVRAALVERFLARIDRVQAAAGLPAAIELRLADPATGLVEKRCLEALTRPAQPGTYDG
jgi:aminoglycoside phosphotransferase (APT) family kinase protein